MIIFESPTELPDLRNTLVAELCNLGEEDSNQENVFTYMSESFVLVSKA